MARRKTPASEDRVFVRDGRKHYRRRYSRTEPRIGVAILIVLIAIVGWVAWKGAHPDPSLFATDDVLLAGTAPPADRSPLPDGLAAAGWVEGEVSRFDSGTLYEKINGREDYYKSLGFEALVFVSLVHEERPDLVVDIEAFDQGMGANALGAYAGERSPEVSPEMHDGGMRHFDRNAYFAVHGRHYIRAIGSEESDAVRGQLEHLAQRLESSLAGEPLPWGYSLFVGRMGFDPGAVSYAAENAFSFGFASRVYSVRAKDGETDLFATVRPDAAAASALAEQFTDGFLDYGNEADRDGEVVWIEDRYIRTIAGAVASGRWVLGVRGAPDVETAGRALASLGEAVVDLEPPADDDLSDDGISESDEPGSGSENGYDGTEYGSGGAEEGYGSEGGSSDEPTY